MASANDAILREHVDLGNDTGERRVRNQPINLGGCLGKSLTSIGTTATEVKHGSGRLTGRRGVYIKNTSTVVLYWGFTDASSGAEVVFPLSKETAAGDGTGGEIWIDVGDAQAIFIKAASGS